MIRFLFSIPGRALSIVIAGLMPAKRSKVLHGHDAAIAYAHELCGTVHESSRSSSPHSQANAGDVLTMTYAQAVAEAKRNLKFLLVLLTTDVHDDTRAAQRTLTDDTLRAVIASHEIYVWAGSATQPDARMAALSLGVTRFPFIGFITPKQNGSMACVSKIEGLALTAEVTAMVSSSVETYEPTLITMQVDKKEQNASREIRAQQDSAYEASLRRDRAQAQRQRQLLEEAERRAAVEKENTLNRLRWLAQAAERLKMLLKDSALPTGQVARLQFRLPDGSRLIRKLPRDTPISDVYALIEIEITKPPDAGVDPSEAPSDAYIHRHSFALATPMPRCVLDADRTIADYPQICPSGTVVVESEE
ncbi:UBX domain-containing protein 10 [Savitreella phatthalungensis]